MQEVASADITRIFSESLFGFAETKSVWTPAIEKYHNNDTAYDHEKNGWQCDIIVTSGNISLGALRNTLSASLRKAGWIEVEVSDLGMIDLLERSYSSGVALVTIDVDASNDPDLWLAAQAMPSALNAEGIAAIVSPMTEAKTTGANLIHILVGPKP
jgi:hypothetical protein